MPKTQSNWANRITGTGTENPADLLANPENWRIHPREQQGSMEAALDQVGWIQSVIVNQTTGQMIDGHLRVKLAMRHGETEIPVVYVALSEAEEKLALATFDPISGMAATDQEMLQRLIDDVPEMDSELEAMLQDLMDGYEEPGEPTGKEDEAPEPEENPVSKLGDVWICGKHRVMCGDSTSEEDVGVLMAGALADLVFTDPPYGVEYQSNMREKSAKFAVLKNDDTFLDVSPLITKFSAGWVFIWTSWKVQTQWVDVFSSFGHPTNMIIWHKPGGGIGDLKKTFLSDYEVALVWNRGAELCGKRIGSVWTINKDGATTYLHPTQKPVALASEAMDKTTRRGNIVLDLFGGSGSTLVAAEKEFRVSRLMELDPKYCDVIVKRWQEYAEGEAVLESSGQTFGQVCGERDAA